MSSRFVRAVITALLTAAAVAAAWVSLGTTPAYAGGLTADPGVRASAQDQIAVGGRHTCAIDAGQVRCWGSNGNGELGYGLSSEFNATTIIGDDESPSTAGTVDIGGAAAAITAGFGHTCALRTDGAVLCWGANDFGQLGYGHTSNVFTPLTAGPVNLGRLAVAITAGYRHTCAILNNGQVRCWGEGARGRLGYASENNIGDNAGEYPSTKPNVQIGGDAIAITAGERHTCVLLATGRVRCWGDGSRGQLGLGDSFYKLNPGGDDEHPSSLPLVKLPGGAEAVSIASSYQHTCAVLQNGTVSCWGNGDTYQLGFDHSGEYGGGRDMGDDEDPIAVSVGGHAVAISTGWETTCAVLSTGATRCWGEGSEGRHGLGSLDADIYIKVPSAVPPISLGNEAVAVAAGRNHSCARLGDGNIRCWGSSAVGELGYGDTDTIGDDEPPSSVAPVDLGAASYPTAVATGQFHSCALNSRGEVRCWGRGTEGQLGYAGTVAIGDGAAETAGPVQLGNEARAITAGARHTCAILVDGQIRCWGEGANGRLGYGATTRIGDDEHPSSVGPVRVSAEGETLGAVAIGAGNSHTCALLANSKVVCWGNGAAGRLGYGNVATIGDTEDPWSPAAGNAYGVPIVQSGFGARALAVGGDHSCVILGDGKVRCWGSGANGRLGYNGTTTIGDNELPSSKTPVSIGDEATAITAGGSHTCARLANLSVRCWGTGQAGRLGYGNANDIGNNEHPSSVGPVKLGSGRYGTLIAAGGAHTCAALDNGKLRCWGLNSSGQLGLGNTMDVGDNEHPSAVGVVNPGPQPQVVAIDVGDLHTCGVFDYAAVWCWGNGGDGRLGYGGTSNVGDQPATLPHLVGPVAVLEPAP